MSVIKGKSTGTATLLTSGYDGFSVACDQFRERFVVLAKCGYTPISAAAACDQMLSHGCLLTSSALEPHKSPFMPAKYGCHQSCRGLIPCGDPATGPEQHRTQPNAHMERQISSTRRECLDWLLILNRRDLQRVLPSVSSTTTALVPTDLLSSRLLTTSLLSC